MRRKPTEAFWAALFIGCIGFLSYGIPEGKSNPDEWKIYFGNLHSHSAASDGVGAPAEAYAWARDEGKLDFLCLSEHNHVEGEYTLEQVFSAANSATSNKFVALAGQEFSTMPKRGGNHVNIYDLTTRIPKELNNNYRQLFTQYLADYVHDNPNRIVVCQFNHPDSIGHDYGIAAIGGFPNYGGNWSEFVSDVDPWVSLIAIISGPSDSNIGRDSIPPSDIHRDVDSNMKRSWHQYLEKGFHLSPVADQDNHRRSWGTRTTARTAFLIKGAFNKENLLKALKAGNCYATEDKDLKVWFDLDGAIMGSKIADLGDKAVSITVRIDDADEPDSKYTVHLYHDRIGDGELPDIVESSDVVNNGDTWKTSFQHQAGTHELFLAHIDQENSLDDAWTAPIWIDPALAPESEAGIQVISNPGGELYAGSKNSDIYHYCNCKVLQQIKPENLVWYSTPPSGKRLHQNCPVE